MVRCSRPPDMPPAHVQAAHASAGALLSLTVTPASPLDSDLLRLAAILYDGEGSLANNEEA